MCNLKITVAGTGYVRLSLAVLLAQYKHVITMDIVSKKVKPITIKTFLFRESTLKSILLMRN